MVLAVLKILQTKEHTKESLKLKECIVHRQASQLHTEKEIQF